MRKVFLHIGFPKTATTYLQKKIFTDSCFNFLGTDSNNKIDKETADNFSYFVHQIVNQEEVVYGASHDELSAYINGALVEEKVNILSSELFAAEWYMADRVDIQKRLHRLCPDAEVIIFLRDPLDYIKSHYLQICKGFGVKNYSFSFESFVDDAIQMYQRNKDIQKYSAGKNPAIQGLGNIISRLQYDKFAEACVDIYGQEKVHFFTYEDFFKGQDYDRLMNLIYQGGQYPAANFSLRENSAYTSFYYKRSLYAGKKGMAYYMKYFYAALLRSPLKNFSTSVDLKYTQEQEKVLKEIFEPSLRKAQTLTGIDFKKLGYLSN